MGPWEPNDQDYAEQQEYLVSLLSSRRDDGEDDEDDLFQIADGFFDNPEASQKLVDAWTKFTANENDTKSSRTETTVISSSEGSASFGKGFRIEKAESETTTTT